MGVMNMSMCMVNVCFSYAFSLVLESGRALSEVKPMTLKEGGWGNGLPSTKTPVNAQYGPQNRCFGHGLGSHGSPWAHT